MKVGDYVRTDKGEIGKITSIANNNDFGLGEEYRDFVAFNTEPYVYGDVIKSSPNIIDLIEVGDVLIIKDFVDDACMIFTDIYLIQNEQQLLNIKSDLEKNKNKKLYSIVTKEQFSQMEYRIGG